MRRPMRSSAVHSVARRRLRHDELKITIILQSNESDRSRPVESCRYTRHQWAETIIIVRGGTYCVS